jgi:hypothetical protein
VEVIQRALFVDGEGSGELFILCGDLVDSRHRDSGSSAPADEALIVVASCADFGTAGAGRFGKVTFDTALFAGPA